MGAILVEKRHRDWQMNRGACPKTRAPVFKHLEQWPFSTHRPQTFTPLLRCGGIAALSTCAMRTDRAVLRLRYQSVTVGGEQVALVEGAVRSSGNGGNVAVVAAIALFQRQPRIDRSLA